MLEFFGQIYGESNAALAKPGGSAGLMANVSRFHARIDELFERELARSRAAVACCAGCSFCCHLPVEADPGEVFRIVDYMHRTFRPEEIFEVRKRAEEMVLGDAPDRDRTAKAGGHPCPLLKDGRCSVHSVRPAQCRARHAQKAEDCRNLLDRPDRLNQPGSQIRSVKMAIEVASEANRCALTDAGYDAQPYDLPSAMVEALEDERCELRWAEHKPAFRRLFRAGATAR